MTISDRAVRENEREEENNGESLSVRETRVARNYYIEGGILCKRVRKSRVIER